MVKLKYLFIIFLFLALIIPLVVVNRYLYGLVHVQCSFQSDIITYGGRVDYVCYSIYNVSPGINTYIVNLKGSGGIVEAYLSLTDVQSKYVDINITSSLRASERITHLVSIPRESRSISIRATVYGIPKDGIYPSSVYIIGGNYPLYCNVSCVYNSAIIIDRPGDYLLEVFSGYGGNGINYTISGGYYISPPYVTISVNGNILYRSEVVNVQTINLPGLRENNIINVDVSGIPNFKILLRIVQRCSLSGTQWRCVKYIPAENKTITRISCSILLNSSCDISELKAHIPFNVDEAQYLKDSSNVKVLLNGVLTPIDTSTLYRPTPYLLVQGIGAGSNVLEVVFDVPYVVAGVQESIGSCIINPMSINIISLEGKASTSIIIRNIENVPIEVYIYPSEEIKDRVEITPSRVIINPNSNAEIKINAKGEVSGYINIAGCTATEVKIPISVQSTKASVALIVLALILILFISVFLYYIRR